MGGVGGVQDTAILPCSIWGEALTLEGGGASIISKMQLMRYILHINCMIQVVCILTRCIGKCVISCINSSQLTQNPVNLVYMHIYEVCTR